MKKNLIALGAMLAAIFTLTNCTEEIQTTPQEEGTPYTIIASTPETKTVNDGLNTKWKEGDQLNVFHAPTGTATYSANSLFTVTDVENGVFATEALQGTPTASNDWYILYPYSDRITTPATTEGGYSWVGWYVSSTPSQDGNNSMAHIAGKPFPMWGRADAQPGEGVPSITMNHLTSLIEVVVNNVTEKSLTVENISFTATENVIGQYYIDFSSATPKFKDGSDVSNISKLNVTNGEAIPATTGTAKFYLAVKPFTAPNGGTLKLAVNGYEKPITLSQDFTFEAGKITTLNFRYDYVPAPVTPLEVPATVDLTSFAPNAAPEYIKTNVSGTYAADGDWKVDASDEYIQFYVSSAVGYIKVTAHGNGTMNSTLELLASEDGESFTSLGSESIVADETIYEYTVTQESYRYFKLLYHKAGGNMSAIKVEFTAPDTRIQLATPENITAEVVEGTPNSIKVSWDAVANATGYTVSYEGLETPVETTSLSYTFENLKYEREYTFSVVATGDAETYKPSAAGTIIETTGENPVVIEPGVPIIITQDGFSSTSGNLSDDENITYEAAQGDGTTPPALQSSGAIRLYQGSSGKTSGGYINITAKEGFKLQNITINTTSTYDCDVAHVVDGGEMSTSTTVSKGGAYIVDNISATSVNIYGMGSSNKKRLEIASISVTYVKQ